MVTSLLLLLFEAGSPNTVKLYTLSSLLFDIYFHLRDNEKHLNTQRHNKSNSKGKIMSPIIIEDNVPVPARVQDRVRLPKLPLDDMTAGQSFKLEIADGNLDKTLNALRMKVQRYQKSHSGAKFSVITEDSYTIRVFCRASNQ